MTADEYHAFTWSVPDALLRIFDDQGTAVEHPFVRDALRVRAEQEGLDPDTAQLTGIAAGDPYTVQARARRAIG